MNRTKVESDKFSFCFGQGLPRKCHKSASVLCKSSSDDTLRNLLQKSILLIFVLQSAYCGLAKDLISGTSDLQKKVDQTYFTRQYGLKRFA